MRKLKIGDREWTVKELEDWTFGEFNRIIDRATVLDPKTGLMKQLNEVYKAEVLKTGVLEPRLDDEAIARLDLVTGERLFREVQPRVPFEELQPES